MSIESHRPVVVGSHGMVSAGDSLAAAEALRILQTGGTAVDAAIAASAVQSVAELPWCGLGGDAFLDFGMDVQTAVDQPRWISGLPYRGENDRTLYLQPTFTPEVIEGLQGLGHAVQVGVDEGEQADLFGNCTVIARSPVDQTLQGAADTRRDAFAIGY